MTKVEIKFNTPNDIKDFVNKVSKYDVDVDIKRGSAILDGKSLEGLFALQLNQTLTCIIHENKSNVTGLMNDIKCFAVTDFIDEN